MKSTTEKIFTHPLGIMAAATGATFLWGSAFPMIKLSYEELEIGKEDLFGQILFAGYRFTLAACLIMFMMKLIGRKISYQRGTWQSVAKIGFFQTLLQYVFFYYGLSGSTGVQGSIIAGTTSFFQMILAHYMYASDKLTYRKVVGLIVGFAGVVLVGVGKGSLAMGFGIAEICLLLSMFFGGLGNILSKRESAKLDILYMTSNQMLFGGLALTLIGACGTGIMPFEFSWTAMWLLAYLAALSALGVVLWNTVMKYNKVGSVSMYLFLMPVFGVFLSAAILNEELQWIVWAALALVVGGIVIVNRAKPTSAVSEVVETNPNLLHRDSA